MSERMIKLPCESWMGWKQDVRQDWALPSALTLYLEVEYPVFSSIFTSLPSNNMNCPRNLLVVSREHGMKVIVIQVTVTLELFQTYMKSYHPSACLLLHFLTAMWPGSSLPLNSTLYQHLSCSSHCSHSSLLCVSPRHHDGSCLRALALTVPPAWTPFPRIYTQLTSKDSDLSLEV